MKDRLVQLERAERLLVKNTNKGKGAVDKTQAEINFLKLGTY